MKNYRARAEPFRLYSTHDRNPPKGFDEGSGGIYVLEQSFRQLDGNEFVYSNFEAWDPVRDALW